MTKEKRIILFVGTCIGLFVVYVFVSGRLETPPEISVILFSAMLMLSFTALFVEHFLTTPSDVLANTTSILLAISPIRNNLVALGNWYWIFFGYNLILLLTSLVSLLLADKEKSSQSIQNLIAGFLKNLSTFFGNGRFLYFSLFIIALLFYVDSNSIVFLVLFGYATIILLLDPKKFILKNFSDLRSNNKNDVGEIIGVESKNIFLAKLYSNRLPIVRFDFVEFQYLMNENKKIQKGLVIDKYLLNQEQWIKVLVDERISGVFEESTNKYKKNVIYKLEFEKPPAILNKYIGIVVDKSVIGKIRFEYHSKNPVSEGDLIELFANEKKVLYQVVQGITDTEELEFKNERGFVIGEAIQLGLWGEGKIAFEKYGWVPEINTPVFLASEIETPELKEGEFQIGIIPNSNYPVMMNLSDAVSHHMAILGVTGCGKSVLARHLIRKVASDNVKVICVDFTNEYSGKFPDLDFSSIVNEARKNALFSSIDLLSVEFSQFENKQRPDFIKAQELILHNNFFESIKEFLESSRNIALFELPDVSNSTDILEYTRWFFKILFEIARLHKNFGKKVCVVIEEAHTVIPEYTFYGVSDKKAGPVVNSIGQIALQGRKYGVGLIIIAQRTANVSKTVLTQCNSIIAFQQFDKTSSEFLSHYFGGDIISSLHTLKFRQAIATGKGFRTGIPIIFEVEEIDEPVPTITKP